MCVVYMMIVAKSIRRILCGQDELHPVKPSFYPSLMVSKSSSVCISHPEKEFIEEKLTKIPCCPSLPARPPAARSSGCSSLESMGLRRSWKGPVSRPILSGAE